MFEKFKFVKGFKKNLKKTTEKKDYALGLHGKFNIYSTIGEDGKVNYKVYLDGEFDSSEISVETDKLNRLELKHLADQIEDVLKRTDPNNG